MKRVFLTLAAISICCLLTASATQASLLFRYQALSIAGNQAPPPYGLRLDGSMDNVTSHEVTWGFDNVFFDIYSDNSAHLWGDTHLAEFNNTGGSGAYASTWELDVWFHKLTSPADIALINPYNAAWDYYRLDDALATEMVNDANGNDYINLWEYPLNWTMPFQVGYGANEKNGNFGAAGWVNYEHHLANGTTYGSKYNHRAASDFLMDLELVPQVPEPATMSLFGLGLAGLATLRRRKK